MDQLLRELIMEIAPRNVITVGKYAAEIFYLNAEGLSFDELVPRDFAFKRSKVRVIPIQHLSWPSFLRSAAKRLANYLVI